MSEEWRQIEDTTEKEAGVVKKVMNISQKAKRTMIAVCIVTAFLFVVVTAIFIKGYMSAKQKFENEKVALIEEIERLSDPVAVYETASKEVDIHVINTEIQSIGELATMEYLYTNASKFEDPVKIFGKSVPFSLTTKSFIVKWDGIIKAGVNISEVTAAADKENKKIIIQMPAAEILSHEIDNDSIETLDQKNGLFNKITVEDVKEFDAVSKTAMENRAVENGLLEKAFENAKGIIESLVNNEAVKELGYTIEFEVSGE